MKPRKAQRIILASTSPQRLRLLISAGFEVQVEGSTVDEEGLCGAHAEATARLRASAKAMDVAARHPQGVVVGGDTVVAAPSGMQLGKPSTRDEARSMLAMLWGTTHRVVSAASVVSGGALWECARTAMVTLLKPSTGEIEAYLATGEPLGKAGGLCVQGLGKRFVLQIEGDLETVVGLPMADLVPHLTALLH